MQIVKCSVLCLSIPCDVRDSEGERDRDRGKGEKEREKERRRE